jgi:hypothetical protein
MTPRRLGVPVCIEMAKFGVSQSDIVAEEHVQKDEGCDEDGKPQE